MDLDKETRELYAIYVELTGRDPGHGPVSYHFRRFLKLGNTPHDLRVLIRWVKRRLKREEVTTSALHVGRLLDPERSAEHLADARTYIATHRRRRTVDPVRRANLPPGSPDSAALTDAEMHQVAESLRKWRESRN